MFYKLFKNTFFREHFRATACFTTCFHCMFKVNKKDTLLMSVYVLVLLLLTWKKIIKAHKNMKKKRSFTEILRYYLWKSQWDFCLWNCMADFWIIESTCVRNLFNKVAGLRPATLLKRDSGTGVFQWILRNF